MIVLPEIRPWVWSGGPNAPFGWTGLKPYQKDGIARAIGRRNLGLWHSTGAGKTLCAIFWALAEPGPVLIVTRTQARRQWASEVVRFSTAQPHVVLPTTEAGRPPLEALKAYLWDASNEGFRPFVIMGWDSLHDDALYAALRGGRSAPPILDHPAVVWDEIHHGCGDHRLWEPKLKAPPASGAEGPVLDFTNLAALSTAPPPVPPDVAPGQRAKGRWAERDTISARAQHYAPLARRRLGLTATPVPKRIRNLYGQLNVVEPGCCGKFHDWALQFCDAYESTYSWSYDGSSNLGALWAFCEPRVHVVTTDEVRKWLPELRTITTYLGQEDLRRACAEATAAVRVAARGLRHGGAEGEHAHLGARVSEVASRKSHYVGTILPDYLNAGEKVLVMTAYRRDVEVIAAAARSAVQEAKDEAPATALAKATVWSCTGEDSGDDREALRVRYMAHPGPCVLIATGDSIGESMNFQDTDRLLHVQLPWTWRQIRQRRGRVHRLGGTRSVIEEYLFAPGTADDRVQEIVLGMFDDVEAMSSGDSEVRTAREAVAGGSDDELLDEVLDMLTGFAR